ncbi:hypothetical protein [Richelia intracellularis]|nr:hypothetical protein [Richelia intracellularis]
MHRVSAFVPLDRESRQRAEFFTLVRSAIYPWRCGVPDSPTSFPTI